MVELRRRYGWGARKLAVLLEREGIRVQEWTVHRILRRQGYVAEGRLQAACLETIRAGGAQRAVADGL